MAPNAKIRMLAERIVVDAAARGFKVAAAESCTGGMVAAALTDISGSSAVVERGFVTYSNEAKIELLGVRAELIDRHGAVSSEVARAMAEGALSNSRADMAVAITGVAGPTGGSPTKPVGLVWFAVARQGNRTRAERRVFAGGSRGFVRVRAVETALAMLDDAIREGRDP
jgi:nicotinamide-nucleotide amidase